MSEIIGHAPNQIEVEPGLWFCRSEGSPKHPELNGDITVRVEIDEHSDIEFTIENEKWIELISALCIEGSNAERLAEARKFHMESP